MLEKLSVGEQTAARFAALRAAEFARLDATGQVYMDHTGSALYPDVLVREHTEFLRTHVLGNPHSHNPTSRASTEIVEAARRRVLSFFRADPNEYEVIFAIGSGTSSLQEKRPRPPAKQSSRPGG